MEYCGIMHRFLRVRKDTAWVMMEFVQEMDITMATAPGRYLKENEVPKSTRMQLRISRNANGQIW